MVPWKISLNMVLISLVCYIQKVQKNVGSMIDTDIETEDTLYQGSNLMATRALSGISIHFSHDKKERQTSASTDITKSFESIDVC